MKYIEYQNLLEAIAKIICYSQIEQKDFVNGLRFSLAHIARKEFSDKSISELSHITGLPRATLSEFLDEEAPLSIISKDSILLSELWRIKDDNNEVTLKGENSFYTIARQILNSTYSPETALNALIESESISLIDEGTKIIILQKDLITHKLIKEFTMYTGKKLKKFVDTALYNYSPSNSDKLFDMTYRTSKTPPKKLKNTHKQIKKLMNETVFPQVKKIIDDNEIDVVVGTYPDYSFNMFESHSDK